jgi:4-hydroxy-4-methyl-2-oxoglutarate aldolase
MEKGACFVSLKMKLEQLTEQRRYNPDLELPISDGELSARLARLYTGAVNDVMREFAIMDKALPFDLRPLVDGRKFAGPAFTIRSVKDPTVHPEAEMMLRAEMLTKIPNGAVCVWDTNRDNMAAHWGGMMTASAVKAGAVAAVVDGGIRDVHQILEREFPIFYRYRTPNGLLSRATVTEYQKPVQIGEAIVNPGDFIFGDYDGVMVVPRPRAYEILLRTEKIVEFEKDIKGWIDDGETATDIVDKGGYF